MDEVVKIKKKKRVLPFFLGLIIIFFSVIGIISTVIFAKGKIDNAKNDSIDYGAYGKYLTWVAGVDPDPFSDITKANHDDLLNIALCSLLTDDVKTGEYEVTADGLTVPAAAVEEYFVKMFGKDVQIVHSSVPGYGYQFTFNEGALTYTVPLTGITPPFYPVIKDAKKTGGLVTLKVGYVGSNRAELNADGSLSGAQPDKYMSITLKETENVGFNLISVKNLTEGEFAP